MNSTHYEATIFEMFSNAYCVTGMNIVLTVMYSDTPTISALCNQI